MNALLVAALLTAAAPARTIDISVTEKGFSPARIRVKKGQPLHLLVTRKTEETCATEVIIEGENLSKDLPLNQPVPFDFTPAKAGKIRFGCAMGMVRGVLIVH